MGIGDVLRDRREADARMNGTRGAQPAVARITGHPEALERFLLIQRQNIRKHRARLSNQRPAAYGLDHQKLGEVAKMLEIAEAALDKAGRVLDGQETLADNDVIT